MHLWQAIKMACKSLWLNKLRSFLTMLGIIIGVMTVALLTSVASGVSTAVVSSIRSQSTLSIVMNSSMSSTSSKMTYASINRILANIQPDEQAEDYFKFSAVKNTTGVVSLDLTGVTSDMFQEDPSGFLIYEKLKHYTDEEIQKMKDDGKDEEAMFAEMHNAIVKARPIGTSIYAVDSNFDEVYDLEFSAGDFPTQEDEILVDMDFVKTFVGANVSAQNAIGQKVSIGAEYYTNITLNFKELVEESDIKATFDFIKEHNSVSGLVIIPQDDGKDYNFNSTTGVLTFDIEFTRAMTNEQIIEEFKKYPTISNKLKTTNGVVVEDIYDLTNSETFTISGIMSDDSTLFTGMTTTTEGAQDGLATKMIELMLSNQKGTCFMLLDDRNLAPLGESDSTLNNMVVSYAYLRYKTEDVMPDSTTAVSLALMREGGMEYMTDFMVVSMNSVASIVDNVMSILTTMLTVISVVSLIVGGIGIMNIMLVAVTERTREIGVRKAIGAKRSSILTQFLMEALMLSLIGGAIGLAISGIGCFIIGSVMGISITMPFWVIGMSIGFCSAIGLIFGMFPAIKASKMQPIDALRHE